MEKKKVLYQINFKTLQWKTAAKRQHHPHTITPPCFLVCMAFSLAFTRSPPPTERVRERMAPFKRELT